jgi:hypothetical protein
MSHRRAVSCAGISGDLGFLTVELGVDNGGHLRLVEGAAQEVIDALGLFRRGVQDIAVVHV